MMYPFLDISCQQMSTFVSFIAYLRVLMGATSEGKEERERGNLPAVFEEVCGGREEGIVAAAGMFDMAVIMEEGVQMQRLCRSSHRSPRPSNTASNTTTHSSTSSAGTAAISCENVANSINAPAPAPEGDDEGGHDMGVTEGVEAKDNGGGKQDMGEGEGVDGGDDEGEGKDEFGYTQMDRPRWIDMYYMCAWLGDERQKLTKAL
jgi:hypothetical protein